MLMMPFPSGLSKNASPESLLLDGKWDSQGDLIWTWLFAKKLATNHSGCLCTPTLENMHDLVVASKINLKVRAASRIQKAVRVAKSTIDLLLSGERASYCSSELT